MLEATDAHVLLGEGARAREAVCGVTLAVRPGEVVSIVGENGCGKSSLASLLCAGRLCTSGSVCVDGIDPAADDAARLEARRLVGLVQQNPVDQIVSSVVADEVAFGPRNLGLEGAELRSRVEAALAAVGLTGYEARDTNALSGGEQQRLALAGVLAMEPAYLVLDEATSMLDPASRTALRGLLDTCAKVRGIGIVQITHEPAEVLCSDRVVALERGRVVWTGTPRELLVSGANFPGNPFAESSLCAGLRRALSLGYDEQGALIPADVCAWLEGAVASGELGAEDVLGVAAVFEGAVADSATGADGSFREGDAFGAGVMSCVGEVAFACGADDVSGTVGAVDATEAASVFCAGGTPNPGDAAAHPRGIEARNVSFSYRADAPVLAGVDLDAPAGAVTLLAGRSGCGKSTLLTLLAGLAQPDAGDISVCGEVPVPGICGMAFQRPESQLYLNSVFEELALAPRCAGCDEAAVCHRVTQAAALVGLDEALFDRYPFELSGGQARRVALASILALDARACLFDEPTAGLDARGRADMHRLVRTLAGRGLPVVVVSHDLEEWLPVVDRVALMASGKVAWQGPAVETLTSPEIFARAGIEPPLNIAAAARLRAIGEAAHAR